MEDLNARWTSSQSMWDALAMWVEASQYWGQVLDRSISKGHLDDFFERTRAIESINRANRMIDAFLTGDFKK
jgi:hypothetical protein